ncbi:hypothetical protein F3Y22_tig00000477pilonHSYRG00362 [Hibiscus syriacus]|uniref:Uncharacterized protein n=1 Tax=Hibiscus syriacus TaxID=106335 RepID=A0A6A3D053_HIBSY|nr:hypothetical protein F3Y22_tig00000477pilonHSYRG00362 [Hibiscus syriacus]
MDSCTRSKEKLAFAQVCVKIAVDLRVPRLVHVQLSNGFVASIAVEIPWLLQRCTHCCLFGHGDRFYDKLTPQDEGINVISHEHVGDVLPTGLGVVGDCVNSGIKGKAALQGEEISIINYMDVAYIDVITNQFDVLAPTGGDNNPKRVREAMKGVATPMANLKNVKRNTRGGK